MFVLKKKVWFREKVGFIKQKRGLKLILLFNE